MTVDREKVIKIPFWLIAYIIPAIVALITTSTMLSATKATLETKSTRNELEIQKLDQSKMDRTEMNLLIKQLDRIEDKLDQHISQK